MEKIQVGLFKALLVKEKKLDYRTELATFCWSVLPLTIYIIEKIIFHKLKGSFNEGIIMCDKITDPICLQTFLGRKLRPTYDFKIFLYSTCSTLWHCSTFNYMEVIQQILSKHCYTKNQVNLSFLYDISKITALEYVTF